MTLRAVIYARCSTEEESQKDALMKQAAEARECVGQKGWLLVDSYVESRSGTSTKGRAEYNRLYDDLSRDKFDIIVIKSQDRLMRNTKDWYLFVDRLTTEQKRLYIYIEHKFYSTDDALITGIKAILAEDYSRELSKKLNNAHYRRQKNGTTVLLTNNTYGYRKLPDKSVEIIEEEAKIKRRMYELCAAGYGSRTVANILKGEGIVNRKGKPFGDSDIRRMVHNPLNKGTVVMRKVHYDFDSGRTIILPKNEQFIHENRIPAIVSEELWAQANARIAKRAITEHKDGRYVRGKNPGKTNLSGKLYCGLCGAPFYRTTRKSCKNSEKIHEWSCKTFLLGGRDTEKLGCNNIHLKEAVLYELLEKSCTEQLQYDREKISRKMTEILEDVLCENDLQPEIEKVKERKGKCELQMKTLVDKLLAEVISDDVYQMKQRGLESELQSIQEKVRSLEEKNAKEKTPRKRIAEIKEYMERGDGMKRTVLAGVLDGVEKIVIYPTYMEILNEKIRIDYGNAFNYLGQKREERESVIEMMKENPQITARQIAEKLDISLSGANYRIKVLRKEGRIRFQGAGGKGKWETL